MMDLLSIVPYYDGHLCAALIGEQRIKMTLGAITYQYDRGYFDRQGIRNRPGLDVAARLDIPRIILRPLKAVESIINITLLLVRCTVSKPDVLHVQFLPLLERGIPVERWLILAARRLGVKIVHTVHNVLPASNEGTPLEVHAKRYRRIYHLADALICHDDQAKSRLENQFDVPAARIRVIPHGPLFQNLEQIPRSEARSKIHLESELVLVLWHGILRPYKGVGFLLDAWRDIAKHHGNARLAIIGTGSEDMNQSVRDQVHRLGIGDSVILDLHFVSVDELGYWLRAADILVYPYSDATTSGALMTGVNHGKPLIATILPAFERFIRHEENGLLVEYGDTAALRHQLERLLVDEQLRSRLGERIRDLRETGPQWPVIARQTRECYEDVVRGVVSE
jgi:glycosyltransferase involved in cell wall biosynthesis